MTDTPTYGKIPTASTSAKQFLIAPAEIFSSHKMRQRTLSTISTWNPKIAGLWSESPKVAERRLPFALFACALLAYAAAFAWHMLTAFDLVNIIRDANYDDSFYYFQIAYNLAQGKFSTFDGGITQTNGYHPVWMLLITPFYWLFDKEAALFGIKALEIMLVAGGAALIALAARLARLAWPLLFAALPMLYHNPAELLSGMETAAAMFALSLLILAVCLYMRHPQRWKWPLAALAFALPWVRIEYIAISLAVTAALCAIEWSRQERRARRLSALANIRHTYIPLIGAIAGILVYFAYNGLVFGGALPVSAVVRQTWSQAKWAQEGGYDFLQNLLDTLRLDQPNVFGYELLIAFEICAYLLLVWQLALRSNERRDWLLLAFMVGAFGLAAGHIAKFAQSILIMHPNDAYRIWYFVPAYIMTALIIPIRLYVAIYLIRRFLAPRWRIAANASSVGVFIIGAALLLARADFAHPFKWVEERSETLSREPQIASYMGMQIVNRALPEDSIIGSWSAGVIGYFSRFPVVHLEGLVNSYEHFNIIRQAGLMQYHYAILVDPRQMEIGRRYGITHFANFRRTDDRTNSIYKGVPYDIREYGKFQFRIWTHDIAPDARDRIDYSQWIWDNMQPNFDYLSDGVGVVLNGRMAQAFAKDCAPDDQLAWTWSEPKHERTVRLETVPYRTHANMCMDARILPHNASRPIQAEMTDPNAYSANPQASEEPIIRSVFDVYLFDGSLIYAKSQCSQEDTAARFFASVFPADAADLPDDRKPHGFHAIEFDFDDHGAIDDGICRVKIKLPDYPIYRIHTGQYVTVEDGYHYPWEGDYKVGGDGDFHRIGFESDFEALAGRDPVIRADFDVYIFADRLIYAKPHCSQEDAAARFFVSVFPAYADSLTARSRQRGYDAIEFNIAYDAIADGNCWAEVALPDYPIERIHTGQYVTTDDGYAHIWEDTYRFD